MERQDDFITREVDFHFGLGDFNLSTPLGYSNGIANGNPNLPYHNPGMEKYGSLGRSYAGIAQTGYRSNLLGRSTQEIQSTYTVRAEDGKQFYNVLPAMANYGATSFEEEAPIDGQRHGYDEEAQMVRANATRMAMSDTYRRSEAKRGGGRPDYDQLAEDMVSREDEVEQMRALYTRKPNQQDIIRQVATRINGGKEIWNDFDFENEHEGGLAAQSRRLQYAKKDAETIQMKNRMDMLYTDLEGNAMDYWSRNFNNRAPTQRETDRVQYDFGWQADQNVQEARANFGSKMDPLRIELYQNLKTHSLLSKDGRSFIPANLIYKVAEMGATHAEQTQLTELLEDCFGKAAISSSCSIRELLNFTEEAAQIEANGPEMFRLGRNKNRDLSWQRNAMIILSNVSQLLLQNNTGRIQKAKINSIDPARLVEKYNTRVNYFTEELDVGRITRQKYNQEILRTLTKFHNDVLETADKHFRKNGFNNQSEKLVKLLDNANKIFQLWSETHREFGKNLSLNEVNAMKKFISFNDELLLSRSLAKDKKTNEGPRGGNVELFLKEYAQELEDVIRISPRFDKLYPGIRADYKREYTKISQQLDKFMVKSAPRALKESVTALGAVYKEIQSDHRVPQHIKQQVLKQIDMSIGKIDATLKDTSGSRITIQQAYELRNMADFNSRMEKEIQNSFLDSGGRIGRHRVERESGYNVPTHLAYEGVSEGGRENVRRQATKNFAENRGEIDQRYGNPTLMIEQSHRSNIAGVKQNYHNDIGPHAYGYNNRTDRFAEGTMADTIANSVYSSAF